MVSYIKTQWWRLLIALYCFVMACIYAFKPAPEVLTVEALDEVLSNMLTASIHFAGFVIWSFISFINHNQDRIELLEKKAKKYDACCSLVEELIKANEALDAATEVDRQYADHLNRKIESFILESKKKENSK